MGARRAGYAVGTADQERDPYLRDPNVRRAASLQIVFAGALGAESAGDAPGPG